MVPTATASFPARVRKAWEYYAEELLAAALVQVREWCGKSYVICAGHIFLVKAPSKCPHGCIELAGG